MLNRNRSVTPQHHSYPLKILTIPIQVLWNISIWIWIWFWIFLGGWVTHVFSSQVQISSSLTLTATPLFQVWGTASWQLQMKNPYRLSQETPLTTFIPCRVSTLPLETSPSFKHMAQSQPQHYTPVVNNCHDWPCMTYSICLVMHS